MGNKLFDTNYPSDQSHILSGALINKEHASLNAGASNRPGDFRQQTHMRTADAGTLPMPMQIGLAEIISSANTCNTVGLETFDQVDAPCGRDNLYTVRFRWWDVTIQQFLITTDDNLLTLDAGGYWEQTVGSLTSQSPTSGFGFGQIPAYQKGDVVNAYWDETAGRLVPITSPYQDTVSAEFVSTNTHAVQTATGILDIDDVWEAAVVCEVKRPTDADWRVVGIIEWRLPKIDKFTQWFDTRSGFCTFEGPSTIPTSTWVRFRAYKTRESTYSLIIPLMQARFSGIGRRSSLSTALNTIVSGRPGGAGLIGFAVNTSIPGRYKDSPFYQGDEFGEIEIQHTDRIDNWIHSVQFSATLQNVPVGTAPGITTNIITSVTCDATGKITQYCYRQFTFPPELVAALNIGAEACVSCTAP